MSKIVAFVDSGDYFERYFNLVLTKIDSGFRFIVGVPPGNKADLVIFSFDGSLAGQHKRVSGCKILVCGEPNGVSGFRGIHLLIDCKDVPSLRPPGVPFAYLPFYVLSFYERFHNKPTDLIKSADYREDRILASKSKFCAFLYHNTTPEHRNRLYDVINKYKHVDALGKAKSSSEKKVDRHHYQKGHSTYNDLAVAKYRPYKFVICCENKLGQKGYITEKMISAMLAQCIPIYWGAPDVAQHFNPRSFINVADFKNLDECLTYIHQVDQDPKRYQAILSEPWLHNNTLSPYFSLDLLVTNIRQAMERYSAGGGGIRGIHGTGGISGTSGIQTRPQGFRTSLRARLLSKMVRRPKP